MGRMVNADGIHDFTYDARGMMETQTVAGEGTYRYGYDEVGRPTSLTYPDGHQRIQRYDDLGRLVSRCYVYAGAERCYTATFDAVGNPVRMADPDGVDVLTYDALDRLTKLARYAPDGVTPLAVEDYAYNALGALSLNAGVPLDHERPRLDGAGKAPSAVPATTPDGQTVTLDKGGFVTSLRGTTFVWSQRGDLRDAIPPVPLAPEEYESDALRRRYFRGAGSDREYYVYENLDRIATLDSAYAPRDTWLFDTIDHPLRLTRNPGKPTQTVVYYELDLARNVRALRGPGDTDLGGYRYTAFGKTVEDTATLDQSLRWQGRGSRASQAAFMTFAPGNGARSLGLSSASTSFHSTTHGAPCGHGRTKVPLHSLTQRGAGETPFLRLPSRHFHRRPTRRNALAVTLGTAIGTRITGSVAIPAVLVRGGTDIVAAVR
jgi:YD repeat-containing protein